MSATLLDRGPPISTGADWTFELIERYHEAIAAAAAEFGLDTYPNQIEIISSEQMLDAYASAGLPIGYPHWSYGKEFIRNERAYRKGYQGLAYEIVINSNPCIAYLMEENTMMMQALVIAHACFGHNSFFKGNYLFRQWTSADGILDVWKQNQGYCDASVNGGVCSTTDPSWVALPGATDSSLRFPAVITNDNGVAIFGSNEPKLPRRLTEISVTCVVALGAKSTACPINESTTESKSTSSLPLAERVSWTKAIEEIRRTASSSAPRALRSSTRRDCNLSSAETVCKLFLTR